ncbi:shikimate 5-dehydrogenase [Desulfurispirillum indicum S5]|uniref:Shikimate dehydrogenase (NADP(+)) n=1 Tax=Desulfurispirillum indicum (strain ATCC BAA-1389 / DSM 22839 / S5) TaxID=653733 RepID=E6W6K5_DESIS|nr:shikimate dehydrogenase [Desulfurispirillum indicum]ADU65005.1 shikimate 5-dehydrogenase [Desulfurispirillum indicum S5]
MLKTSPQMQVFGIVGKDTSYSLSPVLHNAMFRHSGYGGTYVALPARDEATLRGLLAACRGGAVRGLNITVPWKESAAALVDFLDPTARSCGAVNTVVCRENGLWGYNTDGNGFCRSLVEESGMILEGARVVILGAGGAARGIVHALLQNAVHSVLVYNRSPEKARRLAHDAADARVSAVSELPSMEGSIVVNTTSAGMKDDRTQLFSAQQLKGAAYFYDIVYAPARTIHMEISWKANVPCCNGKGMLLWQALIAFELFTGFKCPVSAVRRALDEAAANKWFAE